ncbi:MAG: DNA adenine methylase [bacterium]
MKNIFNSGHLRHVGAVFLVLVLVTEVAAVAVKSPISRVGGKYRLAKRIIEHFPEHDVYVEVFFGAGHVFFTKERVKVEVVNDVDGDLVNFFRVVKYHPKELERQLSYYLRSRQVFADLEKEPRLTDVQRAVRWYLRYQLSFGSLGGSFGYPKRPPGGGSVPLLKDFRGIAARLVRTVIENDDFEAVLRRYDSDAAFFYVDPPYTGLACPYPYEWSEADEKRLWRVLAAAKGRWLVSWGGRFPKELKKYRVVKFKTTKCLSRTKRSLEWAVMNY